MLVMALMTGTMLDYDGAKRLVVGVYLQRLKSWHQRVTDRP